MKQRDKEILNASWWKGDIDDNTGWRITMRMIRSEVANRMVIGSEVTSNRMVKGFVATQGRWGH